MNDKELIDRTKKEFVSKLGIAEEEADESAFWLELVIDGEVMKKELVDPLRQEAEELTKIMASSRRTASNSLTNRKSQIENKE